MQMKFSKPGFTVKGTFIDLKTPERIDLNYINWLWSDPNTMKEIGGPILLEPGMAAKWYEQMVFPGNGKDLYFLIFTKRGSPVGEVGFHRFDTEKKEAELNIKISAKNRGKGYGSEAVKLLLNIFFKEFHGEIISDPVALKNINGSKMLISLGFVQDKSISEHCLLYLSKKRYQLLLLRW